jgi:hypothetical protein
MRDPSLVGTAELSPGRSPGLPVSRKSPVGTTEKGIEMVPNSSSGWGIFNHGMLRDFLVISSRPCGTFHLSNLYPGLRPGLSSAVPAGLIWQSLVLLESEVWLINTAADSKESRQTRLALTFVARPNFSSIQIPR